MKKGILNNRERDTLLRAQRILNAWVDYHKDTPEDTYSEGFAYSMACVAAGGISNFLYEMRGE